MEKTLDNLELKTDPPILIAQLDSLELMLYAVSGAVRDTLLLDFPCAKYIMNGVLLLSDDITSASIRDYWKNQSLPSEISIETISNVHYVLCRNDIAVSQFGTNYACNQTTTFFYKSSFIHDNLRYYHRELFFKKYESDFKDCILDSMVKVDSLGPVYLLKPSIAIGF